MKSLAKLALVGLAFVMATSGSAFAQDPVKERRALMKEFVGKNAKMADQMAKGEVAFDGVALANAMTAISGVPEKFLKLFPAGTDSNALEKSEALPKIWSDMAGFEAAAEKLKTASAAAAEAAAQGQPQFVATLGPLFKACKGCHDAYRIKKEKN